MAKAEKEQKEKNAQDKSRSIMTNFFSKKAPATKPTILNAMNAKPGPSEDRSDFSKTFKPFVIKKDVQVARLNHFSRVGPNSKGKSAVRDVDQKVITIDDDVEDAIMVDPSPPMLDVVMVDPSPPVLDVSTTKGLRDIAYRHTRIDISMVREVTIHTMWFASSTGHVASSTSASWSLQDVQFKFHS